MTKKLDTSKFVPLLERSVPCDKSPKYIYTRKEVLDLVKEKLKGYTPLDELSLEGTSMLSWLADDIDFSDICFYYGVLREIDDVVSMNFESNYGGRGIWILVSFDYKNLFNPPSKRRVMKTGRMKGEKQW